MIRTVRGDVTEPVGNQPVIAHVCNNVGRFGAGVALAIANKYPHVREAYMSMEYYFLGQIQTVRETDFPVVVNMIAQDGIGRSKRRLHYGHLARCLHLLEDGFDTNYTFHMPRIGAGLAGGSWEIIRELIEGVIKSHEVIIYEL